MGGEQVVGGIVVVSGVADEGGEKQFRVELASAVEGLHAGGAVMVSLFVAPAIVEAGPAGGAVMAGVAKRRMPVMLLVSALVTVWLTLVPAPRVKLPSITGFVDELNALGIWPGVAVFASTSCCFM